MWVRVHVCGIVWVCMCGSLCVSVSACENVHVYRTICMSVYVRMCECVDNRVYELACVSVLFCARVHIWACGFVCTCTCVCVWVSACCWQHFGTCTACPSLVPASRGPPVSLPNWAPVPAGAGGGWLVEPRVGQWAPSDIVPVSGTWASYQNSPPCSRKGPESSGKT